MADANEHGGRFRVAPGRLADLIGLVQKGTLSQQAAKRVFAELAERDGAASDVAERLGLIQVGDAGQLATWIEAALAAHPEEVRRYQQGEGKLIAFFMGVVMKESGGRADPKRAQAALREKLS